MTAAAITQASPTHLTILYDEWCALCRRARDWLLTQPCLVDVELIAAGSPEAEERFGAVPWLGQELVVVDEQGNAWVGPSAFIAAMWATARYRSWAFRLSRPHLAPHAEQVFRWVSKSRQRIGGWLADPADDCSWCEDADGRRGRKRARKQAVVQGQTCPRGHLLGNTGYCVICSALAAGETP